MRSPEKNIYWLYLIKASKWFMLYMPIVVLFYQENGLSMQEVFLLKSIYSIAVVLLEIPSGYLADAWGRRSTMILGALLGTAGFILYSFGSTFLIFLFAELILGLGQSFISGSDSALLYDSLKAQKKEDEYLKLEGRIISFGNFSETAAAILGGLLAGISLRSPFIFQVFIAALAIPASLLLLEPESQKPRKIQMKEVLMIVSQSLWGPSKLKWFIYLSSLMGAATLSFAWFIQPYFKELHFRPQEIGFIWAGLNFLVGIVSFYAYRFERKAGYHGTLAFIVLIIGLSYFFSARFTPLISLLFIVVFYLARGIATPVFKNFINRNTSSEIRATVLSVRNFVIRLLFAIISPFLGWYSDHFNLSQAISFGGMLFLILSLPLLIPLWKNNPGSQS